MEFFALVHGVTWGNEKAFGGDPGHLDRLLGMVLDGLTPAAALSSEGGPPPGHGTPARHAAHP